MDIQKVIKKYGYTIQKVADKMPNSKDKDKIGISQGSLSTIINGNPTISTLQAIADVIGCSVADFFADEMKKDDNSITCPHCGKKIHFEKEI